LRVVNTSTTNRPVADAAREIYASDKPKPTEPRSPRTPPWLHRSIPSSPRSFR
jgi:hypothetical protein